MSEQQQTSWVSRAWDNVTATAETVGKWVDKVLFDAPRTAVDLYAGYMAVSVVAAVKSNKLIETCVTDAAAKPGNSPDDGRYMGKDCPQTSETMRAIANSRCAEVIGIYNATDGPLADIANANLTIEGRRNDPAAIALSETVRDHAASGEPLTLYAHSEGGLNSIVGLRDAYEKMERSHSTAYADAAMQNITVYSFGTAETGWPDGPRYRQYTNISDPVPHVIRQAQASSGNSALNLRQAANIERVRFNDPFWDPIEAHSMDTYLNRLNGGRYVRKGADGNCCGG